MTGSYALIKDHNVINTMAWDGDLNVWRPPEGCTTAPIPEGSPVSIGWTYFDGEFVPPPITREEWEAIEAEKIRNNQYLKKSFMQDARDTISVLTDAEEMGVITDEEREKLKAWKAYRLELYRINADTSEVIEWPVKPE